MDNPIYIQFPGSKGIGDAIALANYVYESGGGFLHDSNPNLDTVLQSPLFDFEGRLTLTSYQPNVALGFRIWDTSYSACKKKWERPNNEHKKLCMQCTGGVSNAQKNMTQESLKAFESCMESSYGIEIRRIGLPLTLEASAEHLLSCDLFVGCLSGMSVLALALGVPIVICLGGLWCAPNISAIVNKVHRNPVAVCGDLSDAAPIILKTLGIDCA